MVMISKPSPVEPYPWQVEEVEFLKSIVKGLSLCQPTHIVHARVDVKVSAAVALHASAGLSLTLQHRNTTALGGKNACAFKPSKAAAYYACRSVVVAF